MLKIVAVGPIVFAFVCLFCLFKWMRSHEVYSSCVEYGHSIEKGKQIAVLIEHEFQLIGLHGLGYNVYIL